MALDPNDYKDYEQRLTVNIKGVDVVWAGVPAVELTRILPTIKAVAADLKKTYRTELKISGAYLHLSAEFKAAPDPSDVLMLKSIACGLLVATSWGGPG